MTFQPRIYVAASGAEVDRASRAMRSLEAMGARIVGDWTAAILGQGREGTTMRPEDRVNASVQQLVAVRHAHGLLLLVPPDEAPSIGAWVELGVAWSTGIPIVASHPGPRLPFMASWALHDLTDESAALRLLRIIESAIGGPR